MRQATFRAEQVFKRSQTGVTWEEKPALLPQYVKKESISTGEKNKREIPTSSKTLHGQLTFQKGQER